MKVLVTGRAGSGKSAVAAELQKRGYKAFDSDEVVGLSSWQDRKTGALIKIADNTYVDLQKYRWVWDNAVLEQLLRADKDIFVCGGADNDLSFYSLFDKQFVLDIEPTIQIKRLQMRIENDYGKDPRMFDPIIAKQAAHFEAATKQGAIVLDASLPINDVVNKILESL